MLKMLEFFGIKHRQLKIHVQQVHYDQESNKTEFIIDMTDTVESLKTQIQEKLKIPLEHQTLIFAGKVLNNLDQFNSNWEIQNESILHLIIKKNHPLYQQ